MKFIVLLVFILLTTLIHASASSYLVKSLTEAEAALKKVKAGDELIIANGSYQNWSLNIPNQGNAKALITIKAEREGEVIFSGEVTQSIFKITGDYVTLKGIRFENCIILKSTPLISLNNTNTSKITDCIFIANTTKTQFTPLVVFSGNGESNEITNCRFSSNVDNQDVQVKITKDYSPLHTLIADNVFELKRKVSWKNNNGGECIQIGQDPVLLGTRISKSTIKSNRFIECNAEGEIISNKSSENTYINNYFENNQGELVLRGGHDCIIVSNIFEGGSGGIRVNGTGHKIENNQINKVNTGIRLMYGMVKGKAEIGFYVAASNNKIYNNTINSCNIGILIGDSKNVDWTGKFDTVRYPSPVMQNVAPFDNIIKENKITNTKKSEVVN
ncbi:MAG: hypothetical protein EOO90_20440 [Pedobacter sp.]|nr:MAG: hypothetical protein EOO90_20440 [Pedobacter sp.]